jgi:hypothetical protein
MSVHRQLRNETIAAIIIAVAVAWYKYVFGQRIKIIDPQLHGLSGQVLQRLVSSCPADG